MQKTLSGTFVFLLAFVGAGLFVLEAEATEDISTERIMERLTNQEERIERRQERFCERIGNMNERFDIEYPYPDYCEKGSDEPHSCPAAHGPFGLKVKDVSVSNTSPTIGEEVEMYVTVENTGEAGTGELLIEIEDENEDRLHDDFQEHLAFGAKEERLFSFLWTPVTAGLRYVDAGAFSKTWGSLYDWAWHGASFTVLEDTASLPDPEPEAPTLVLSADPSTIAPGASSTLSWDADDVNQCEADWTDATSTEGVLDVTPTETTAYEMTCAGEGGEVTESVTVTIEEDEPEEEPESEQKSNVVINEVAWMGSDVSANDEWIELYNRGDAAQDLTGWTITSTDGTPAIVLSGSIGVGEYYLLERQDDDSVPAVTADLVYPFGDSLGNGGEVLELKDDATAVMDTVDGSGGWTIGGDNGTKETAQRSSDDSWFTAEVTPKAENFADPN
jgi:hypothetical protein